MNQAIIFKCFDNSEFTQGQFKKLAIEAEPFGDVYLLFDSTNRKPLDGAFNVSEDDYRASGYPIPSEELINTLPTLPPQSRLCYFNPEYQLLLWWREQKFKYDFYWTVESDIHFMGDWGDFFREFEINHADLIGTWTDMLKPGKSDGFYPGFWSSYNFDCDDCYKQGTFGAMLRYSNKLLEVLESEYLLGRHGFYEVIVPTLAKIHGLTVSDVNYLYPSKTFYDPFCWAGAFKDIWKEYPLTELYHNKLFHPVKDLKELGL